MADNIATDSPFSASEKTLIRELAGLMVPASEEYQIPGADDDAIIADIWWSAASNVDEIRVALGVVEELPSPLSDHLEALQANPQLAPLVVVVMQCYYRDDRVMESLDMEARPPFPKGFEVPQGDWSMLEKVQARGKIWRDA